MARFLSAGHDGLGRRLTGWQSGCLRHGWQPSTVALAVLAWLAAWLAVATGRPHKAARRSRLQSDWRLRAAFHGHGWSAGRQPANVPAMLDGKSAGKPCHGWSLNGHGNGHGWSAGRQPATGHGWHSGRHSGRLERRTATGHGNRQPATGSNRQTFPQCRTARAPGSNRQTFPQCWTARARWKGLAPVAAAMGLESNSGLPWGLQELAEYRREATGQLTGQTATARAPGRLARLAYWTARSKPA